MPPEGVSLGAVAQKYGMPLSALLAGLKKGALEYGAPIGELTHKYSSLRAQELSLWAASQGRGPAFNQAVFEAYFVEALNIYDLDVLAGLAGRLGLDRDEARRVLEEGLYASGVEQDHQRVRQLDIQAVPTFIIGPHRLVGAQPYENFERLMATAGLEKT